MKEGWGPCKGTGPGVAGVVGAMLLWIHIERYKAALIQLSVLVPEVSKK